MNGREIKWPMVPTDSTNPILLDFDSLVANVATCVWKGVDWKSIANTCLLPNSRVRVVLGGHVQLSASKFEIQFFLSSWNKRLTSRKKQDIYIFHFRLLIYREEPFLILRRLSLQRFVNGRYSGIQLRTWKLKMCRVVESDMKRVVAHCLMKERITPGVI